MRTRKIIRFQDKCYPPPSSSLRSGSFAAHRKEESSSWGSEAAPRMTRRRYRSTKVINSSSSSGSFAATRRRICYLGNRGLILKMARAASLPGHLEDYLSTCPGQRSCAWSCGENPRSNLCLGSGGQAVSVRL